MPATAIRHEFVELDDVRLHCAVAGSGERTLLLLHGFPDGWHGWAAQIDHFAPHYTVIAPDGRGCGLSAKPEAIEAYRLPRLVADARSLIAHYSPSQRGIVVGHDWGGVVAWSLASLHPECVSHLVVANAPHPRVLARALAEDPEQRTSSSYLQRLRQPDAESLLAADEFARLRAVLDVTTDHDWRSDPYVAACVEAWSRPGALTGALNWYRANDFQGDPSIAAAVPGEVAAPTLLLWGRRDRALLPHLAGQHREIAARCDIRVLEDAGHWTPRECPDETNALITAHCRG